MYNKKIRKSSEPYFNSIHMSVLATFVTAIMLMAAYLVSWLNWFAWFAFVPFLLAVHVRKRLFVYAMAAIVTLLYSIFVIRITSLYTYIPFTFVLLAFLALTIIPAVLIAEAIIQSRRFSPSYGWVIPAVIWTIIIILFQFLFPNPSAYIFPLLSIMPVSQIIFQHIAGTGFMYVLLFAVLLANAFVVKVILDFKKKQAYPVISFLAIFAVLCALIGGHIKDLPRSLPEEQGMNSDTLKKMVADIPESHPQIRAVVIVRHGKIVFEKYFGGCTPYALHYQASVTKSVTGALTGIAIEEGFIKGSEQKMMDFFPEYNSSRIDPKLNEITIENLLTMKTGLYSQELDNMGYFNTIQRNDDWIKPTLSMNMRYEPDQTFSYNSFTVHMLSCIINRTAGTKHSQFSDRNLFGPLGIYRRIWPSDPMGNNTGGWGMFLRTRDMAKFGYLYLREGNWNGKQIIPSGWVDESTTISSNGGSPHGEKYGYLFWITEARGHEAYFAGGFGGQFIYVVPDQDLVVAISSQTDRHREDSRDIVPDFVMPAVEE